MDRLAGQFGATAVEREFGTPTALDEWAMTLRHITDDQVLAGLDRLRQSGRTWIPSATHFAELCRGDAREAAWAQLLAYVTRDEWFTDPAAYAVAEQIGFADLRGMTAAALRASFDRVWRVLDLTGAGPVPERVTDRARQLEAPKPTGRAEARDRLRAMRARVFWDEQPLALPKPRSEAA